MKEDLFTWDNIKFGIREFIKMYSTKDSFFSYKRFQTGTAFFIYTQGAMYTLNFHVHSVSDFIIWATPSLLIAGYTLNKTEQAKKEDS